MTRVVGFAADFICNTSRILVQESRVSCRHSSTVIQTAKEEADSCIVQEEKPKTKFKFSIRSATEGDLPTLTKIRQYVGIHDVQTVFQSFLKIDPKGFKLAVDETGKILGSASCVRNSDDNHVYFGGVFCVEPKYQNSGIGQKLFQACWDHFNNTNAVPGMKEEYRDRGSSPEEEKDWACLKNQTPNHVSPEGLSSIVPPGVDSLPLQDAFLPEMIAYDEVLLGYQRTLLLSMSCNETNSKT